jgi:hypothetical protein
MTDFSSYPKSDAQSFTEASQGLSQDEGFSDYAKNFVLSGLYGAGNLIGISAPPEVEAWNYKHPIAGIAANLIPGIGYYTGAARLGSAALKATTAGTRLLQTIDTLGGDSAFAPFIRRGLGEMVSLAPVEAGRLATTALLGNDIKEVGTDIILGEVLTGAIGGGLGVLESAGQKVTRQFGSVDGTWPTQLRARELAENIAGTNPGRAVLPENMDAAKEQLAQWRSEIRSARADLQYAETDSQGIPLFGAAQKQSYIRGELEGDGDPNSLGRAFAIRRSYDSPRSPTIAAPLRVGGEDTLPTLGFRNDAALADVQTRAGLPDGWEDYAQYPTYRRFNDTDVAKKFQTHVVDKNMSAGPDGWMMAKERDGLYVLGKPLAPVGEPVEGAAPAEWVFLKTDDPAVFAPSARGVLAPVNNANAFFRRVDEEAESRVSSEIFQTGKAINREVPLTLYQTSKGQALLAKGGRGLADTVAKMTNAGDVSGAKTRIRDAVSELVAPAAHQFRHYPRAQRLNRLINGVFDSADALATKLIYGESKLDRSKKIWMQLLKAPSVEGSPFDLIQKFDDADLNLFTRVLRRGGGVATANELGASENVTQLVQFLQDMDSGRVRNLHTLADVTGVSRLRVLPDHLGVSRSWTGDHRVPIQEGDALVGFGSGFTPKQAAEEAQFIAEQARVTGRSWVAKVNESFLSDALRDRGLISRLTDSTQALKLVGRLRDEFYQKAAHEPGFFRPRKGAAGYQGQFRPLTKDQLLDAINRHTHQSLRYEAELTAKHIFGPELARLKEENGRVYAQVQQRMNDRIGIQGPFSAAVNRVFDTVLSGFLGKNSASKIIRGFNNLTYTTSFGFGNIAFPVMQMMQFIQTVIPELYYIRGGIPERLADRYTAFMRAGPDGFPREITSRIDPVKMIGRGFKMLGNPDAEFVDALDRARNTGVINPRIREEFTGSGASFRGDLANELKKPNGILGLFKTLNSLPEKVEGLTRAHSFATGWQTGRDILGLDPDKAFQFASEFTKTTMYGYSVADRSRIFTGPFGSAFGLFKNWQMHYIYQMMDYAGAALAHGQWRPLLTGFAGSAALGGLPAAGPAYWIANKLAKDVYGKDIDEKWYEQYPRSDSGPNASDALFMGIPGFLPELLGLPGVSLTGAFAMPFSDPTRDLSQLMSFVYIDRAKYLGQAVGDAFESAWTTGQNPLRNPEVVNEVARALMPRTLYRTMQQTSDGAIRSSSSLYPTVDGLSKTEQVLYSLGFNPNKLELAYRLSDRMWADEQEKKTLTSGLGKAFAQAQEAQDYNEMSRLQTRVFYLGLDMDHVMKSANPYAQKYRQTLMERQGDKKMVQYYQSLGLL